MRDNSTQKQGNTATTVGYTARSKIEVTSANNQTVLLAQRENWLNFVKPLPLEAFRSIASPLMTDWRSITPGLTQKDIALLESDKASGFTPDVLLWNARDMASDNLWQRSN